MASDRQPGSLLDAEPERGGEADGAKQPQSVLGEARGGIADGAEDAGGEVGAAVDEVDDLAGFRVLEQSVDGEIAASGVGLGVGEADRLRMAAVDVYAVAAEGRDLDDVAVVISPG